MLMRDARFDLIGFGKKLIKEGLTKGTGGNLSIFDREKSLMAITPSGIDFFEIRPEDIVIMDLDGKVVEGDRVPSSEWEMHLLQYKHREDISSVIHAHTMYATVLACLRVPLEPTHYLTAVAGPDVRCAKYATYGSSELAVNALEAMEGRKAVLLANHGILVGAENISRAFSILNEIEYCCEVYYRAKSVGEPVLLSSDEMELMARKFQGYGQKK